ncbi:hypothetical protein HID58_053243 [Brassica napus]|uniref:CASP-like protein n=1 Tax=Brassica napus TaxID=3708 RepID=A0ABQ8AE48_BRANA|nr:hypothetical protein HID58_053243 [Brassica napus]
MDLLAVVSAPDRPDPLDASFTLVALDLSSFPCHCFTLAAARSPLHCTTTSDSVCLLIVSLGVNLVKPLLLSTDGYSHCLTQYKAVRHLVCLPLPRYEVHLPQYEVHLPRHEVVVRNIFLGLLQYICVLVVFSDVSGSSRWCLITSVAKFLAALYAFVAAVCSGSSSLNVFSNFRGFISLNSTHAVYLVNVAVLLCLLKSFSIDGV